MRKMTSMLEDDHSCSIDTRVSVNVGTHRTSRRRTVCSLPRSSFVMRGRSPIPEHACSTPSAQAMRSSQGRKLMRSSASGWLCQVQPLSTMMDRQTAPMTVRQVGAARDFLAALIDARARTLS